MNPILQAVIYVWSASTLFMIGVFRWGGVEDG